MAITTVVLILLPVAIQAQGNCNCPRESDFRVAYTALLKNQDATEEEKYKELTRLSKDPDPRCAILGHERLLSHLYNFRRREEIPPVVDNLGRMLKEMQCPDTNYVWYYNMLGLLGYQDGNLDSMTHYTVKAIECSERTVGAKYKLNATYNLAATLLNAGDYKASQKYFYPALKNLQDPRLTSMERVGHMRGCATFYLFFYDYLDSSRADWIDSSMILCNAALSEARQTGQVHILSAIFNSMADALKYKKMYREGLAALDSADAYAPVAEEHSAPCSIAKMRLDLLSKMGKHQIALAMIPGTLSLCDSLDQLPAHKIDTYRSFAGIAVQAGDYQTAYQFSQKMHALQDSVQSTEKLSAIRDIEEKYQKTEKEAQIRTLQQDKDIQGLRIQALIWGIVAALLLAAGIILFVSLRYRQRLIRSRQALLEAEQRLNRARINPHVFFNILSSLQALSLDEQRRHLVPAYMARYAKLMRVTLESTYHDLIPLEDELSHLEDYLALQSLRFPNLFSYSIELEEGIDPAEVQVPPLVLQPFAENSIEHGFSTLPGEAKAELKVKVTRKDGSYLLVVEDNGKAQAGAASRHPGFPSRSAQIMEDRFLLLNAKLGEKAKFALSRIQLEGGYRVEMAVPA